MTIDEVVKELGIKPSVVEKFRDTLLVMGLLKPGKSLKAKHVAVLKHALELKEETKSKWSHAFMAAIDKEHSYESSDKVVVRTPRKILIYLTEKINEGSVLVNKIKDTDVDDSHAVKLMVSLLEKYGHGVKGKDVQSFSFYGSDDLYYLVIFRDSKTNKLETHLFYNSSAEFNIMNCKCVAYFEPHTEELDNLIELCEKECL